MGLIQLSDVAILEAMAQEIVDRNPVQLDQYLSGKDRVLAFFIGLVMKETKGQANPQMASDLMKKILDSKKDISE